jgi:hypothetical protein
MRKEILVALYKTVGGVDAGWISDFQALGGQIVGNPKLTMPIIDALDAMTDWNYHYMDLEAVIQYELKLQHLFDILESRILQLININGDRDTIYSLQTDLQDVSEAIQVSYITLNASYIDYTNREEDINDKIVRLVAND